MSNSAIPYSDVTILIPTLNEEKTIGRVIDGFSDQGFTNILVIDGESTDETQKIAKNHNATVIVQKSNGKGAALQEALEYITTKYVVTIDGDATYDPSEVTRLLKPLVNGNADEVLGNRFANMQKNAMKPLHKVGNKLINTAFFLATQNYKYDILTGYRAYTTETLRALNIDENHFGVETELCTKSSLQNLTTTVVPITYHPRPAGSEANLNSVNDGFDIIKTLVKIRFQNENS